MAHRPSVPAPRTSTVDPSTPSTPWTAQAAGSTITAASSSSWSGTGWIWLSWATIDVDHPPPVSWQ